MSGERTQVARRFYPSERLDLAVVFQRDDAVELLESQFGDIFHKDFETVEASNTVTPAGLGMTGFIGGWREWLGSFESWSVVADDFEEAGEKVLVTLDIVARSRTDRVDVPTRGANVLVFRDGKIARVELHTDVAQARRAAGLEGASAGSGGSGS